MGRLTEVPLGLRGGNRAGAGPAAFANKVAERLKRAWRERESRERERIAADPAGAVGGQGRRRAVRVSGGRFGWVRAGGRCW